MAIPSLLSNGTVYPPGPVTPLGSAMLLSGIHPTVAYIGWEGTVFNIMGGLAPQHDYQNGLILKEVSGLQSPFHFLDNEGARQEGITYLDSLRDPAIINMTLEAWGDSPNGLRKTVRAWTSAWRPDQMGVLSWFTQQLGEWYMPVRQAKELPDHYKQYPAMHRRQIITWTARGDNAYWQGVDSVSSFPAPGQTLDSSGAAAGFNALTNIGTEQTWIRHLVTGPGTFTFGDATSGNIISFGPLLDGQRALITTLPRLRSVVDLSDTATAATPTALQKIVEDLVNYATTTSQPPLLSWFESRFGILPPNGPMYSLLNGRFNYPLPGKRDSALPTTAYIPVSITGGSATSRITSAITPLRTYPE